MRVSVCILPLLALACAPGASAMDPEFSEFRLGLGFVSGFDQEKVTDSTLSGAPDPGNDKSHDLSGKVGFDAQPGLWMGSTVADDVSLVFGVVVPLRTPSARFGSSTDTGTANGSGTGDILLNYHERINTVMFGAKIAGGVGFKAGPVWVEVTPFIGAGAIRAHFQEALVYTNDPNNLLTPNDSNASYTNNGSYFEYGLSGGAFFDAPHGLRLGATAGWQVVRAVVHIDQHGPFMDSADRVLLMRSGFFLDAVAGISF